MHLFDVIATNIKSGEKRPLAVEKEKEDAEAIVKMAVMRRGCDIEFYGTSPSTKEMKKEYERMMKY